MTASLHGLACLNLYGDCAAGIDLSAGRMEDTKQYTRLGCKGDELEYEDMPWPPPIGANLGVTAQNIAARAQINLSASAWCQEVRLNMMGEECLRGRIYKQIEAESAGKYRWVGRRGGKVGLDYYEEE